MKYTILTIGVLFFLTVACTTEEPIKSEYASIYTMIRMANTEFGTTTDSAATIRASIFKHYAVSEENYIKYIATIKKDPTLWKSFQEAIIADLKNRQKILDNPPVTVADSALSEPTTKETVTPKKDDKK